MDYLVIGGDEGAATITGLNNPTGIAVDAAGNIYIVDYGNQRIRKVNTSGVISTVAGNGTNGYNGDGGAAASSSLGEPWGAVDAMGNIYIADWRNHWIRKVDSSVTVPVTFASFNATANNKTIQTQWHTATEQNTSHFIIQHSTDGSSFTDIGTVKAIGSGANSYSFTDTHPANGINYYCLQSVDKDGASSFSKVVSASLAINDSRLTIHLNPARSTVIIRGSHISFVQVIDNMGRVVKTISLHDATNPTIQVSTLVAGVYHLRIQTTDGNVRGAAIVISD